MTVMGSQQERTERIEALRGLIERLGAPDLTLTESKVLRGRLSGLLQREDQPAGWDRVASSPALLPPHDRVDGPRREERPSGTSMRAAG
jgi:hypothetical protein